MHVVTQFVCLLVLTSLVMAQERLATPGELPHPDPEPETPGPTYEPPLDADIRPPVDAPEIYEHSADAGPDQTFFLTGGRLGGKLFVWGRDSAGAAGREWECRVQLTGETYLAATLPDRAHDAPFLVWAGNDAGWSRPIRLNVPQAWWCRPRAPTPGSSFRIFGRDLARRPDRSTAFVYLAQAGRVGVWLQVVRAGKYELEVTLPADVAPGRYQVWVHAGSGGPYGWGPPLTVTIAPPESTPGRATSLAPSPEADLRQAVAELAAEGGGTLRLAAGAYPLRGTLVVPENVGIAGAGMDETRIQLVQSAERDFARVEGSGWNQSPSSVHTAGDTIDYEVEIPSAGTWHVWLRYATEMSPWDQPGVSGNMSLQVDDGEPVPLENLPNTGSFDAYAWSRAARIEVDASTHRMRWRKPLPRCLS